MSGDFGAVNALGSAPTLGHAQPCRSDHEALGSDGVRGVARRQRAAEQMTIQRYGRWIPGLLPAAGWKVGRLLE